jgi:hypothetical protein
MLARAGREYLEDLREPRRRTTWADYMDLSIRYHVHRSRNLWIASRVSCSKGEILRLKSRRRPLCWAHD